MEWTTRPSRVELAAVGRTCREEAAVHDVGELERPGGYITGVDDAVITEERGMGAGLGKTRFVAGERLQSRLHLDRVPEAFLEDRPDVLCEVVIDRRREDTSRLREHRASL